MKILHVSAVKSWGGGENQIELLFEEFKNNFQEVKNLILCVKDGLFYKKLKRNNLSFKTAPLSFNFDLRYSLKIIKICKEERIDLIHIHDPKALSLVILADNFYSLPPMVFSKKTSFPIKNRKQTLYKYNHPKLKRILCVSKKSRDIAAEKIKDEGRLKNIYHGVSIEKQKKLTAKFNLREKLELKEDVILVGNIGNHIPAKDLTTFIETAEKIVKQQKKLKFHFVQIGHFTAETPPLLKYLTSNKLESHISFLGFQENASSLIPQLDFLLHTSISEGVPNVIYEAFYHKTPVISTNVGGIPEIVTHMENGLLADAKDAEKLAELLLFLQENKTLISRFTENGHKKLVENFTTKQMAQQTLLEYKNVLYGRY
ncbi:Glycosyltransferase involved in cell wall bisynthesis [Salegentibacter holothuriorum]|uniref:Glycosyltransferase involved in cell wall bisynthesis n=1 Tax=Salegentibacter holothuriorum TaxID=241145 RepID=A0A1T5D6Z3_9FLAO|nr:glycosyltransferase family 4 protein [Salegentibacter holothuriorum]SKB67512.1 Glycosyltransferase involved in cell wall bisynthesis [Salegentibacter holothuriorum]